MYMNYFKKRSVSAVVALLTLTVLGRLSCLGQNMDPDSFNKHMKYAGLFFTGEVDLDPSPSATPPPQGAFLVNLNPAPTTATFDVQDIGKIVIPKNTARTIIYYVPVLQDTYGFRNDTGAPGEGELQFDFYFTLENTALSDPSVIDPSTGMPANGKLLDNDFAFAFLRSRSLQPGENETQETYYTRGGLGSINRQFFLTRGIAPNIVDKIFKNDTTIRVHLRGLATFVSHARTGIGFRMFTDD